MEVIVCDSAGFCGGVRRAIRIANSLCDSGLKVYSDGPLVHNSQIMESLRRKGIDEFYPENFSPSKINCRARTAENVCILIRAHGISAARRDQLGRYGIPLFDATCPCVAQISKRVSDYARRGYYILLFGEKTHPESRGIISYASNRSCIFADKMELDSIVLDGQIPVLFSQTTASVSQFEEIADYFMEKFPRGEVINTICAATRQRQSELSKRLRANGIDGVIVVGGRHSSNTRKLYEMACEIIGRAFLIETAAELKNCDLTSCQHILLTGGASTPPELIAAVELELWQMN